MSRSTRLALLAVAVLLGLYALHIHLNQGGLGRAARRLTGGPAARGELQVGFLPVT